MLARRFLVAPTPEHYTSKTCFQCGGPCAAHNTIRTRDHKEVRGLRVCQDESCKAHLNRDANAARNIGKQFCRPCGSCQSGTPSSNATAWLWSARRNDPGL